MPELSVEITGKADKLEKALNNSKKGLKSFEKDTNNFQKNFNKSTTSATKNVKGFQKGVGDGQSAMTSFSRVIQDAPYGINGVANNITNLTEQFGYLKNRTGSTSGALRAMLKNLRGFGGVTFGISLATSLIVAFGDKIGGAAKKTNNFVKAVGEASTGAVVKFKVLTDTLLDVTASERDQAQAIKMLKKEFSDFDTSLLTNKTSYEKAKIAVDNYTASLISQARSQAALGLIEEKQSKILELEEKRMMAIRNSFGSATIKQFEERRSKLLQNAERQAGDLSRLGDKERQIREQQLQKNIDLINTRFDAVKSMGAKEIDELETQIKILSNLAKVRDKILFGKVVNDRNRVEKSSFLESVGIPKDWKEQVMGVSEYLKDNPIKSPEIDFTPALTSLSLLELRLLEFSARSNQIIQGSIIQTFNQLGQGIGNALANGGNILESIGLSLLNSMGQFLSKMGGLLIQYGIMAKLKGKLDLAIAKGGAFAIVAGTAAIAAGIALKAIGGAISRGATGGFASSGGGVNSSASTYSSSSSGSFSGGDSGTGLQNIVFEIQGTKLIGVLNNTLQRNSALGGTLTIGG